MSTPDTAPSDVGAVDLFSGVGGVTAGLEAAGIPVNAGVELNERCRYAYEHNNDATFVQTDVADLSGRELESLYDDADVRVLAGCAPCQPFSNLNNAEDTTQRSEYGLLDRFGDLIAETHPDVVAMENVTALRGEAVYSDFVRTLSRHGYQFWVDRVDCPQYGIPQRRKRLVLLASRHGPISLADPTHDPINYPTVRDTIGDLPPIEAGEVAADDRFHLARTLEEQNLERVRQSRPGGTWRDWDPDLRLDCHTKESGQSYDSVYGRMEWDAPGPTVTTQFYNYGSGRFGHPEQDRAISLREGAMLQTFPNDYEFLPMDSDVEFQTVGRFVGNAVPVRLAEIIGETIRTHLETHDVI